MKKVINYAIAYGMWIADLMLAFWLAYLSRTDFLGILALFYKKGQWQYSRQVDFADKAFMLVLGLGWLALMVIIEEYFRVGIQKKDLLKRFARVTGPVLLCLFVVDLILFWLEGIGSGNWLRWIILAAELGIGTALLVSAKTRSTSKPN
jgi:hypothetical protein